jgi:hypothetical protein
LSKASRCAARSPRGATRLSATNGRSPASGDRRSRAATSAAKSAWTNHRDLRRGAAGVDPLADPAEHHAHDDREQGPEQEQQEGLAEHRRGEIAAGDDEGGAERLGKGHAACSCAAAGPSRAPRRRRRWR